MDAPEKNALLAVGVDGCRGGWAVVALRGGTVEGVSTVPAFREVLLGFPEAGAVAVDIPIGLPPPFPREADLEARRFLGHGRSRVFLTFPRSVYVAATHPKAVQTAKAVVNQGCSIQAFALGRRILEVEARRTSRVYEVHPEVSFTALAGGVLPSKKTKEGRAVRRAALRTAGIDLPCRLPGAAEDDLLDAGVAAWSARRILYGEALTIPASPGTHEPRIWF